MTRPDDQTPRRARWGKRAVRYALLWGLPVAVALGWVAVVPSGSAQATSPAGSPATASGGPGSASGGSGMSGLSGHLHISGTSPGAKASHAFGATGPGTRLTHPVNGIYKISSLRNIRTGANTNAPMTTSPTPGARGPNGTINAAWIYQDHCSACHGLTARGTERGPSLVGVGEAAVDFELVTGRMPKREYMHRPEPYHATLSILEIKALDRYVTALAAHGGPPIPKVNLSAGSIATGGQIYRDSCAGCHDWSGRGGELVSREIPPITESTPIQVGEAVRVGPDQMPPFGRQAISRKELNDVIAYVEYMRHPNDRGGGYGHGGTALGHLGPVAEGAVTWLVGGVLIAGAIRWLGKRS